MTRLSTTPSSPSRTGMSTPNQKLRRKVDLESAQKVEETPAIQRLVEYFVVVSSVPQWEQSETNISSPMGGMSPRRTRLKRRKRPEPKSPSASSTNAPDPQSPNTPNSGNIHVPHNAQEYTFQPCIKARYPRVDYPDNPLNPMITHFCYPHSDSIVPSQTYVMPRIHHFVLTNEKGRKLYGTCLTTHEEYLPKSSDPYHNRHKVIHTSGDIEVTVDTEGGALYVPRVLCILSTWPYLMAFREYLTQLYRLSTTTSLMEAPIERYILNLCLEIPAPPPGAFELNVSILNSDIKFWAPPAKLPIAYVALPYQTLFECLDLNSILVVWYALLFEQKVLLVSSQYSILTVCAEAFCSFLFPLQWSHLYIPLLPRFLSPMLDAPVPYLVGCIRENWVFAEQNLSSETIVVDLDSNDVIFGSQATRLPTPPIKKWEKLKAALATSVGEVYWKTRGLENEYRSWQKGKFTQAQLFKAQQDRGNAGWKEKLRGFDEAFNMAYTPDSPNLMNESDDEMKQSQWEQVQEVFLRFFVATLKNYKKFLHIPDSDKEAPSDRTGKRWSNKRTFDRDGYIAWQKNEHQHFYSDLCLTQHFDDFITKRLYSPGEPDCIFFDQHIDAKMNRSKLRVKKVDTPFLVHAKAHKVLKTVQAVEPNRDGLPEGKRYCYNAFPVTFDDSLFGEARQIPSMITAEFDRQAALVARLRAHHAAEKDGAVDAEFFGADYEPNPEVATFTVFFFVYGAIIGLDWQEFERTRLAHNVLSSKDDDDLVDDCLPDKHSVVETEPETDNGKDADELTKTNCSPITDSLMSGMVLNVPECTMHDCEVCPDSTKDEFVAQWVVGPTPAPPPDRNKSLLDSDLSVAQYEEARAVALAQLDLAFEVLATSSVRRLPIDADAFKSLMEACGRCGNTDRAIQLIQMMKRDGFVADREIYSFFVAAFAQDDLDIDCFSQREQEQAPIPQGSDAYSSFLKKRFGEATGDSSKAKTLGLDDSDLDPETLSIGSKSTSSIESGSRVSDTVMSEIYNAVFNGKREKVKKKKRFKSRRSVKSPSRKVQLPVTSRVLKQVRLGENLLEYLYPGLKIDTACDPCPQCSNVLGEDDVVTGWDTCEFHSYETQCGFCKHRFVPHFAVSCQSELFQGSQGKGTPLYCEYLSPWVLRRELERVIHGSDGIVGMQNPEWRDGPNMRAILWWNLILSFNRYRLPVSFLLQGSFQNKLIQPTLDQSKNKPWLAM